MASEIIHSSPMSRVVGEFDLDAATKLLDDKMNFGDRRYFDDTEWGLTVCELIPADVYNLSDDDLNFLWPKVETQEVLEDPTRTPHVDAEGTTLIGSNRRPTINYVGDIVIPSRLKTAYLRLGEYGSNPGSEFFNIPVGQTLIAKALKRGDLHPDYHPPGTLSVLARTAIHEPGKEDTSAPDYGNPRLLIMCFDSKIDFDKLS